MTLLRRFVNEMVRAAWAQRVHTVVTMMVVVAATLAVVLTVGRAAATEKQVMNTLETTAPRVLTVRKATAEGSITTALVDQMAALPNVQAVIGFRTTADVRPSALPGAEPVAVREIYGLPGVTSHSALPSWLVASRRGLRALGFVTTGGSASSIDGEEFVVAEQIATPEFLSDEEPLVVRPLPTLGVDGVALELTSVLIVCRSPQSVRLIASIAARQVDAAPGSVVVETSREMAQLQSAISGQLRHDAYLLLLGVLASTMVAIVVDVLGLVSSRRKDFGRRRALGATRLDLILLTVGQVCVGSVLGAVIGMLAGLGVLAAQRSPVPPATFFGALALVLVTVSVAAAAVPAVLAAHRDPLSELRVP